MSKMGEELERRLDKNKYELWEACKAQHNAIDLLFAKLIMLDRNFFPSKSGEPWEATVRGHEVLAKIEGQEKR